MADLPEWKKDLLKKRVAKTAPAKEDEPPASATSPAHMVDWKQGILQKRTEKIVTKEIEEAQKEKAVAFAHLPGWQGDMLRKKKSRAAKKGGGRQGRRKACCVGKEKAQGGV